MRYDKNVSDHRIRIFIPHSTFRTLHSHISPLQFRLKYFEVITICRPHEIKSTFALEDRDSIIRQEADGDLTIHGQHQILPRSLEDDLDQALTRNHNRPVGEHMRADRRQEYGGHTRMNYRAAGGKRVS